MVFLFFLVFSSGIFNYGMGLQSLLYKKYNFKEFSIFFIQIFIEIFLSLSLSWFLIQKILIPSDLLQIFPLIVFLSFYFIHSLIALVSKTIRINHSTEIFIPILILIMSILHSAYFSTALVIAISCLLSYFLSIPIIYAIQIRIDKAHPLPVFKTGALILISLSVIMLSLLAFDLSWLLKVDL